MDYTDKEEIRKLVKESIKKSYNETKQVDEIFEPISFTAGVGGGIVGTYAVYYSVRKVNSIIESISKWLDDPFGTKKRRMQQYQQSLDSMLEKLRDVIGQRDEILKRGEEMNVREMKEAQRLSEEQSKYASKIRNFLSDDQNQEFVEVMDRRNYNDLLNLLRDAENGQVTFDSIVAREDEKKKQEKQPSFLSKIFGS